MFLLQQRWQLLNLLVLYIAYCSKKHLSASADTSKAMFRCAEFSAFIRYYLQMQRMKKKQEDKDSNSYLLTSTDSVRKRSYFTQETKPSLRWPIQTQLNHKTYRIDYLCQWLPLVTLQPTVTIFCQTLSLQLQDSMSEDKSGFSGNKSLLPFHFAVCLT